MSIIGFKLDLKMTIEYEDGKEAEIVDSGYFRNDPKDRAKAVDFCRNRFETEMTLYRMIPVNEAVRRPDAQAEAVENARIELNQKDDL